jgi:hypothetical protein
VTVIEVVPVCIRSGVQLNLPELESKLAPGGRADEVILHDKPLESEAVAVN